jgi:hypothetical protein
MSSSNTQELLAVAWFILATRLKKGWMRDGAICMGVISLLLAFLHDLLRLLQ